MLESSSSNKLTFSAHLGTYQKTGTLPLNYILNYAVFGVMKESFFALIKLYGKSLFFD
jgi:hypothetical protein